MQTRVPIEVLRSLQTRCGIMKSHRQRARILRTMTGDTNPMQRFGITALLVATIATSMLAQPRRPMDRNGPVPPPDGGVLATYHNRTADQKTIWTAARQAFETVVAPLHDKVQSTQEQLHKL